MVDAMDQHMCALGAAVTTAPAALCRVHQLPQNQKMATCCGSQSKLISEVDSVTGYKGDSEYVAMYHSCLHL